MAGSVRVAWTLPVTRKLGGPLAVEDIARVEIEQSADGGTTFGLIDLFTPDVLETTATELEFGRWHFRGRVVDQNEAKGDWFEAFIDVLDTSPPGTLNLTLVLV